MTKDQLRQIRDAVDGILEELNSDDLDEEMLADYGMDIVSVSSDEGESDEGKD